MLSGQEVLRDWRLPAFLLWRFWGPIGVVLAPVRFGKQWYPLFVSAACRVRPFGFCGFVVLCRSLAVGSGGRRGPRRWRLRFVGVERCCQFPVSTVRGWGSYG